MTNKNEALMPDEVWIARYTHAGKEILGAYHSNTSSVTATPRIKYLREGLGEPAKVTMAELMYDLQAGSLEGELFILHALAKKYPNGLIIVEDKS